MKKEKKMSELNNEYVQLSKLNFLEINEKLDNDCDLLDSYVTSDFFIELTERRPYYFVLRSFYEGEKSHAEDFHCQSFLTFLKDYYPELDRDEVENILELDSELTFKILLNISSNEWAKMILNVMLSNERKEIFYDLFFASFDILNCDLLSIIASNDNFEAVWVFFDRCYNELIPDDFEIISEYGTPDFIQRVEDAYDIVV
jgi:hypothetical protein